MVTGGPYKANITLRAVGTAEQPIFYHGLATSPPVMQYIMLLHGKYLIVEGWLFDKNLRDEYALTIRPYSESEVPAYVCVRDNTLINYSKAATQAKTMFTAGYGSYPSATLTGIVFYGERCRPRQFDGPGATSCPDTCCIICYSGCHDCCILDNHLHDSASDGLPDGHGMNYGPNHIYMGRNVIHDTLENGIDLKEVDSFVVSENVIYNMPGSGTWSRHGQQVSGSLFIMVLTIPPRTPGLSTTRYSTATGSLSNWVEEQDGLPGSSATSFTTSTTPSCTSISLPASRLRRTSISFGRSC